MNKRLVALTLVVVVTIVTVMFYIVPKDNEEVNNDGNISSGDVIEEAKDVSVFLEYTDNTYVMRGASGTTLMVKSMTDVEQDEMFRILYPNGVVDAQGQNIQGIENAKEVRDKFLLDHLKTYSIENGVKREVEHTAFEIELEDNLENKKVVRRLFKAQIGEDVFVFPYGIGRSNDDFEYDSEKGIYIVKNDDGIWKINLLDNSLEVLTYEGENRVGQQWVGSFKLTPDGKYVIYRTDRDVEKDSSETSIWKINIETGVEEILVESRNDNDIVGFIDDETLVLGCLKNTVMVNVNTGVSGEILMPELPNRSICGVSNGKIIYSSYFGDGAEGISIYVSNVKEDSSLEEVTSVTGVVDSEIIFSPSGNKFTVGCGSERMLPKDDIIIFNLEKNTQTKVSEMDVLGVDDEITYANRACWIDDNTLMVVVKKK